MNAIELTRLTGDKIMVNVSHIVFFTTISDEQIGDNPTVVAYKIKNGTFVYLMMIDGGKVFVQETYTAICRMLKIDCGV